MVRDMELLESAKSGPLRRGKRWLIKYLEGGSISRAQAVEANCYQCLGMGDSGDCDQESCPLLPWSPFRPAKQRISRATAPKQAIPDEVSSV